MLSNTVVRTRKEGCESLLIDFFHIRKPFRLESRRFVEIFVIFKISEEIWVHILALFYFEPVCNFVITQSFPCERAGSWAMISEWFLDELRKKAELLGFLVSYLLSIFDNTFYFLSDFLLVLLMLWEVIERYENQVSRGILSSKVDGNKLLEYFLLREILVLVQLVVFLGVVAVLGILLCSFKILFVFQVFLDVVVEKIVDRFLLLEWLDSGINYPVNQVAEGGNSTPEIFLVLCEEKIRNILLRTSLDKQSSKKEVRTFQGMAHNCVEERLDLEWDRLVV